MNPKEQGTSKSKETTHNLSIDWSQFCDNSVLEQLLDEPFELNTSRLRTDEQYIGFDNETGETWIYPTNLPIRQYQFNITRIALFRNTLVVLPTGLGKTFIAAVVMFNIYRWYPQGKVIFMAPTRPLVAQQIDACSKIMGIPSKDTAEMTGKQNKKLRQTLWQTKRVFFATPQVVQADICDNEQEFPINDIKLVVIDEAHKAKGRYAYSEVVRSIHDRNQYFRVLALSATPGHRIEDVAEVIKNLYISHMEIRWDNSIDVVPYIHKRSVKTIVVPLDDKLTRIRNELIDIIDPYIRNLIDNGVLSGSLTNINRNFLLMEHRRFREMSLHQRHHKQSSINTDFSISISLYHALELLEKHGLWVFLNYFEEEDKKGEKFFVALNPRLRKLLEKLRKNVGSNPFHLNNQTLTNEEIPELPKDLDFGHPKFEMAKKVLIEHITTHNDSRVIIFCEYRDSVRLMYRLLLQNKPLVRPKCFVGQGGTGSVTQKQQLQIMKDFRSGASNTIIATSVAEEGIDVGEVDLIICFDISSKNPTRFIQRIGRTGRRKQGNVIMLATEGKEQNLVKEVLASKDKANRSISRSKNIQHCLYKLAPRLVPPEFNPTCLQLFIEVENDESNVNEIKKKTNEQNVNCIEKPKKGKKAVLPVPGSQDVRNFFKKIDRPKNDVEQYNDFVINTSSLPNNSHEADENLKILPIIEVLNNDCKPEVLKLVRKFNSVHRNLDIPPKYKQISNPEDILKSKTHSKLVKRFILEKNYEFVKDKYDGIQAILAIGDDETDNTAISAEEKKLKKDYATIENIFGGKLQLETFLMEMDSLHKPQTINFSVAEHLKIFDGLTERDFCDDNQNFIASKLNEIETINFPNVLKDENIDIIKESEMLQLYLNDSQSFVDNEPTESNYMDQWTQFKSTTIQNHSTPLSKPFHKRPHFITEESSINKTIFKETKRQSASIEDNISKFFDSTLDVEIVEKVSQKSERNNQKMFTPKKMPTIVEDEVLELSDSEEIPKIFAPIVNQPEVDLFDDDFDDIFEANTEVFTNIEKSSEFNLSDSIYKAFKEENNEEEIEDEKIKTQNFNNLIISGGKVHLSPERINSSAEYVAASPVIERKFVRPSINMNETCSLMPVDELLDIVAEKEKEQITKKVNISNPALEDFDLNDFLEPFDEEEEIVSSLDSGKENYTKDNINLIQRPVSVDLFESPIKDSVWEKALESPKRTVSIAQLTEKSPSLLAKRPISLRSKLFKVGLDKYKSDIGLENKNSFLSPPKLSVDDDFKYNKRPESCSSHMISKEKPTQKNSPNRLTFDESVIHGRIKKRNLKRIFNSSSESDTDIKSKPINSSEDSDEEMFPASQDVPVRKPRQALVCRKRKRLRNCEFVDNEAAHSDDDEDDFEEAENSNTMSQYMLDSVVVLEEEEDDPSVNMRAKYLQSIRSPVNQRGVFKIPAPRQFNDYSSIFSQHVPEESLNTYREEGDSFIVSDEERAFDDDQVSELCPLEQAEKILKERRKAKRRAKNNKEFDKGHQPKKKKLGRIILLSSDDEN